MVSPSWAVSSMGRPASRELIDPVSLRPVPWIDVSVPVRDGMIVYAGDPEVRIERVTDISRGDPANVSRMELGAHTGTHVDAPLHFLAGGPGVDRLPLDALIGP